MSLTVDTSDFALQLRRFVVYTGADAEAAALRASRSFMRHTMAITPPGDGAGTGEAALTKEDRDRGEASIRTDLGILFAPVRIKGKRREAQPDLAPIHRAAFIAGKKPGKRIRRTGPVIYADERKVAALTRELFSRVGKLAANWLEGAIRVGARAPAWVQRHGPRGFAKLSAKGSPHFRFEAANPAVPAPMASELDRRLGYAATYTGNGLERQLRAILEKRARQARFAA